MKMQFFHDAAVFLQVSGITEGRAATILPLVLGLLTLVVGWIALARSAKQIKISRLMSAITLATGLPGVLIGILHLVRATGAIGTGSGRLGAIVAMILCLVGMLLGVLASARSKRIAAGNRKSV